MCQSKRNLPDEDVVGIHVTGETGRTIGMLRRRFDGRNGRGRLFHTLDAII